MTPSDPKRRERVSFKQLFSAFKASNGVAILIFGAVFIILASYWTWLSISAYTMRIDGQETVARIDMVRVDGDRGNWRSGQRHFATYRFDTPGVEGGPTVAHQVKRPVPRWLFRQLRIGDEVTIRYDPDDPDRIEAYSGEFQRRVLVYFCLAAIFGVFTAGMSWRIVPNVRRNLSLDLFGRLETGRIVKIRVGNSHRENPQITLTYPDGAGGELTRIFRPTRNVRWSRVRIGEKVEVRVDPADPTNARIT